MKRRLTALDRKQLDARFAALREAIPLLHPPRGGWIRSLRNALGMRQRDLANRLDISTQAVADLERREVEESVTLSTLREAARALKGELYYAVVPVLPVSATLEERAEHVARFMLGQIRHSMRMEDQATGDAEARDRLEEIRQHLLQRPSSLWDLPDDV